MINILLSLLFFIFASAFTFNDLNSGGMDAGRMALFLGAAFFLNLLLGMQFILLFFNLFIACILILFADKLCEITKTDMGRGDFWFIGIATVCFPFPNYGSTLFGVSFPIGLMSFVFAAIAYMVGRLLAEENKSKKIPFGPFLFAGLALAVMLA